MKRKLGLLLATSALILSACGPTKVSYAEYKKAADEAAEKAKTVTVKALVIDNSGKLEKKDFKVHEEYKTVDGVLTKDEEKCTYEGEASVQIAAKLISAIAISMKANSVVESESNEYAIKPLTVYSNSESSKSKGEMSFDDYGNMTKLNSTSTDDGEKSTYKLTVKYTYEKI